MMNKPMTTIVHNPRYLINVGLYSAIYLVVFLATAAIGLFGPPFLFVGWLIGTIANASVLTLYRLRTPAFGAMTLLGLLEGLVAVSRGYPWYTAPGAIGLGLIADAIATLGGYTNRIALMVSYAVFAPWIALPLVPVIVNREAYFAQLAEKASNQAYVTQMQAFLTPTVVLLWALVLVITGLIGGYLANAVMDKHFRKAGMVA